MNKSIITAVGNVNAKRMALTREIKAARKVLYTAMESIEGKAVAFRPDEYWAKKIEAGEAVLDDAVVDEGGNLGILWRKDDDITMEGFIKKVAMNADGVIEITAITAESEEEVTLLDQDTPDIEKVLQFVDTYAQVNI